MRVKVIKPLCFVIPQKTEIAALLREVLSDDAQGSKDPSVVRKRSAEADTAAAKAAGAKLDLIAKQESVLEGLYDELDRLEDNTDERSVAKRARTKARADALLRELNTAAGIGDDAPAATPVRERIARESIQLSMRY